MPDDPSGFAVGISFVRSVAKPRDLVVGIRNGALHAETWKGADFSFRCDSDFHVDVAISEDGVGDVAGGVSRWDLKVEGKAVGGGLGHFGDSGIGAGVAPHAGAGPEVVGAVVVDGRAPEVEVERRVDKLAVADLVGGELSGLFVEDEGPGVIVVDDEALVFGSL